ncbi:MAG TPA: LysM domain-containing protein, partial [Tahibacter sp.]|nr:LysM domain-containing protein [Tahibacter sp.]
KAAVPIDLVGAANGVKAGREIPAGATVFLPSALGRSIGTPPPAPLLPGADANDEAAATVVVKSGDSLWTLSRRHGVGVAELKRLNGLSDKATLKPGQKLKLRAAGVQ